MCNRNLRCNSTSSNGSLMLGPWGPCCGNGSYTVEICTCKPVPCPAQPPISVLLPPEPCPPPCTPCPPTYGVYQQLMPKPPIPCPPPCPPRLIDFGCPPCPPCPPSCPPIKMSCGARFL